MTDMNHVFIVGRLTADPELKTIQNNVQLCRFSIAVNRSYTRDDGREEQEVSFFQCTAWERIGDAIYRYASKGRQIAISGRLRQNRWQDSNGVNRSAVEIVVTSFQLFGQPGSANSQSDAIDDPEDVPF
jgi:single-strand DNA-binding protein